MNDLFLTKWDYAFMDCAKRFARLSTANKLKVGAVIVKDKRIISIGYNGMPSGWSNVCEDENGKTKPEVSHAEENAILKLAESNESGKGATIYLTHDPCIHCAKLIYGAGITCIHYEKPYKNSFIKQGMGSGPDFLRKNKNIKVVAWS